MKAFLTTAVLVLAAIALHAQPAGCVNCLTSSCVVGQNICGYYCHCAAINRGDTQGVCVLR